MASSADQYNRDVEFKRLQGRMAEQEDQLSALVDTVSGLQTLLGQVVEELQEKELL